MPPVMVRNLVGAICGRNVDLHHNQVRPIVKLEFLDMLIRDRDFISWIEVRRKRRKAQRREERIFDRPEQGTRRFGECRENHLYAHISPVYHRVLCNNKYIV